MFNLRNIVGLLLLATIVVTITWMTMRNTEEVSTGSTLGRKTVMIPFIMSGMPDPLNIYWSGDWAVCTNTWVTLVDMDWLGQPLPALARKWTVTSDGLNWTFELAHERRWSDGSPITASQIAESLKRSQLGSTHSRIGNLIESIEGREDQVFIRLKRPLPNLLGFLAFVDWGIFHPDTMQFKDGKWSVTTGQPCSGPFCFQGSPEKTIKAVELRSNPFFKSVISSVRKRPDLKTAYLRAYQNCSEIIDAADQLLGFRSFFDDLKPECKSALIGKGFILTEPRPAWLQKADFTKKGLAEISLGSRLKLVSAIGHAFLKEKELEGRFMATGLRSTHLEGSLSKAEYSTTLEAMTRMTEKEPLPTKLSIVVVDQWSRWPTYKIFVSALKELGIQVREEVLARSEFNELNASGKLAIDFDLKFAPFGAGDPDPDTSWQYAARHLYPSVIKPEELEHALLEEDRQKRNEMYKSFSKRVLEAGLTLPLQVTSDVLGLHKSFEFENSAAIKVGVNLNDYVYKP